MLEATEWSRNQRAATSVQSAFRKRAPLKATVPVGDQGQKQARVLSKVGPPLKGRTETPAGIGGNATGAQDREPSSETEAGAGAMRSAMRGAAKRGLKGLKKAGKFGAKAKVGAMPKGAQTSVKAVFRGNASKAMKIDAKTVASRIGKLNTIADLAQVIPDSGAGAGADAGSGANKGESSKEGTTPQKATAKPPVSTTSAVGSSSSCAGPANGLRGLLLRYLPAAASFLQNAVQGAVLFGTYDSLVAAAGASSSASANLNTSGAISAPVMSSSSAGGDVSAPVSVPLYRTACMGALAGLAHGSVYLSWECASHKWAERGGTPLSPVRFPLHTFGTLLTHSYVHATLFVTYAAAKHCFHAVWAAHTDTDGNDNKNDNGSSIYSGQLVAIAAAGGLAGLMAEVVGHYTGGFERPHELLDSSGSRKGRERGRGALHTVWEMHKLLVSPNTMGVGAASIPPPKLRIPPLTVMGLLPAVVASAIGFASMEFVEE